MAFGMSSQPASLGSHASAVRIEKVSCQFNGVTVVRNIDLAIKRGEFVTLLGPSGCGKTTTLRMIAGLELNSSGRILIGDTVVSDHASGRYVPSDRRRLGMVFQSYAIWPHMTVFDNVAYPLRIRRRPAGEIKTRVADALRLVEMEAYADRPAPALSGGQQQRIAIARALVFEPEVLLLDEPLSNLDARLRTQMGDEFRALQRRLGITTIYVTHDQAEAMALSDEIVVMEGGSILQRGEPEDIYFRPQSRAVAEFLGSANLIAATVTESKLLDDGRYALHVHGDAWSGTCAAAAAISPGSSVWIVARAESLELGDEASFASRSGIRWSGRVMDSIFRGPSRSVAIDVGAHSLNVQVQPLRTVMPGEPVDVFLPLAASWAVR